MLKRLTFVMTGLLVLSFLACQRTGAIPSEQDAEKVWHNTMKSMGLDKDVELISLRKTNGQFDDANSYTLSFEVKERYLTNRLKKQGQVSTVQARYTFTRTEKGWLGPDQQVY